LKSHKRSSDLINKEIGRRVEVCNSSEVGRGMDSTNGVLGRRVYSTSNEVGRKVDCSSSEVVRRVEVPLL
jgi:hypothetical protein